MHAKHLFGRVLLFLLLAVVPSQTFGADTDINETEKVEEVDVLYVTFATSFQTDIRSAIVVKQTSLAVSHYLVCAQLSTGGSLVPLFLLYRRIQI